MVAELLQLILFPILITSSRNIKRQLSILSTVSANVVKFPMALLFHPLAEPLMRSLRWYNVCQEHPPLVEIAP
jgi:hypothetical protein